MAGTVVLILISLLCKEPYDSRGEMMNLSSTGGGPCQLHFSMGGEGITFDK